MADDRITWDDKLTGFGLRERNGRRTWIIQYRVGPRQRRLKIGSVEKLSEAQARNAARKTLAKVELGEDPAAEKARAREEGKFTLRAVATDYLAARKADVRSGTYREMERHINRDWKPLHAHPLNTIERRDVAIEVGKIARRSGATTAARARSTLSALYTWAMGEGIAEQNPVVGTNKPMEPPPRDRVLDGLIKEGDEAKLKRLPELRAVWHAAADDAYGRIVRLLILTACRREEIGGLLWSEVDLERRMIHLPGERCKNGQAHDVWLSDLAWSLLPERRGEYVFGGRAGFAAWARGKTALDKRLGDSVAPFRVHDLRRTVATRLADLGVMPHVIECILNHQSGHKAGVAGIYNKSRYDKEVRGALMLWSDHVRAVVEGEERTVVPMRRAADALPTVAS
jgi:integrase